MRGSYPTLKLSLFLSQPQTLIVHTAGEVLAFWICMPMEEKTKAKFRYGS